MEFESDGTQPSENPEIEKDPLAQDEPVVPLNGEDAEDVTRRTRPQNASSHFVDPDSENDEPREDSDQEYQPPEAKSKGKNKAQGLKRRKSETVLKTPRKIFKSEPSPVPEKPIMDPLNFAPIKITSVTSLSTDPPKPKPKANNKRNVLECQVAVKSAISNSAKLGERFRTDCHKIGDTPKDTREIINSAKTLLNLLRRTKSHIGHIENVFKADISKIFAHNNCSSLIENDSDFSITKSSNGKAQDSDSDCEIVDSTPSTSIKPTDSSNIYNVLKKMEKQGISWKNSKALTTSDKVLNAMAKSKKPVMIGKDIIVKKVPNVPKKNMNNSFFWLDGRTLKPPDSSACHAFVMTLRDITEHLSHLTDLQHLDLYYSDVPNVIKCMGRVYVCEYVEEMILNHMDDEFAKKTILNTSEPDKVMVLSKNCSATSSPKSLFLNCLNAVFGIYDKVDCENSFIYNEFKNDMAVFRKQFTRINDMSNCHTATHYEGHLKSYIVDKNILNFFDILVNNNRNEPDILEDSDSCYNMTSGSSISDTSIDSDDEDSEDTHQIKLTSPKKLWGNDILINQILDDSSDSEGAVSPCNIKKNENTLGDASKDLKVIDSKNTKRDSLLDEVDRLLNSEDDSEVPSDDKQSKSKSTSETSNPNDVIELSDDDNNTMVSIILEESNDYSDSNNKSWKKKRKKTRKIMDDKSLKGSTKKAVQNEIDRINRLHIKQEEKEEYFNDFVTNRQDSKRFTLDYYHETKEEVYIHPDIAKELHHHQLEGVKFMWDSCFDSVESLKNGSLGSGCILAHCMGLGKTLQVVALTHSVLTSPITSIRTVLVCCPLPTVFNWVEEYKKWLNKRELQNIVKIYEISQFQQKGKKMMVLQKWQETGGVLIIGYEALRCLTNPKSKIVLTKAFQSLLLNPGADLVVCDEGHMLKNENTSLAMTMNKIRTKRRIVLTGTPLQNNLKEYYCMVNFIKPHLLGTPKEYMNRFINPITNGQHRDSTSADIKIMKKRSHVLHKMLEGCVQRKEASILYKYLPAKQEFVLFITLSELQAKLYERYLNSVNVGFCRSLLKDYHVFRKIWTHPKLVENGFPIESDIDNLYVSHKLTVMFSILSECKAIGEKLLIFCDSLKTLDLIEYFLEKIYNWKNRYNYYRMDGSVNGVSREKFCNDFNSNGNTNIKLMLISTKTGGQGINLTGANRAIIMDVSWNPAHDLQSVFRIYRFGQMKNCYIYRLIARGTMEEKIYERSVTKESIACRVVDEQQINQHYSLAELNELYTFEHIPKTIQIFSMPLYDNLLSQVLSNLKQMSHNSIPIVCNMHNHDSLLRNLNEEQLNDSERREAWIEYEAEKLKHINLLQTYKPNRRIDVNTGEILLPETYTNNPTTSRNSVINFANIRRNLNFDFPNNVVETNNV